MQLVIFGFISFIILQKTKEDSLNSKGRKETTPKDSVNNVDDQPKNKPIDSKITNEYDLKNEQLDNVNMENKDENSKIKKENNNQSSSDLSEKIGETDKGKGMNGKEDIGDLPSDEEGLKMKIGDEDKNQNDQGDNGMDLNGKNKINTKENNETDMSLENEKSKLNKN